MIENQCGQTTTIRSSCRKKWVDQPRKGNTFNFYILRYQMFKQDYDRIVGIRNYDNRNLKQGIKHKSKVNDPNHIKQTPIKHKMSI